MIGLISAQKRINRESITDDLVRLGRKKGEGAGIEIFVKVAELVRKGQQKPGSLAG